MSKNQASKRFRALRKQIEKIKFLKRKNKQNLNNKNNE